MSVSTILFSFKGRIARKHYLPSMLAIVAISSFLGVVLASMNPGDSTQGGVAVLVLVLFALVFWSSLALSIKRLHDCDYAGWFVLLSCIPIAGWLWFLVISLMRGTAGANRFGPDPVTMPSLGAAVPKGNSQTIVLSVVAGALGAFCLLLIIVLIVDHNRVLSTGDSPAAGGVPSATANASSQPNASTAANDLANARIQARSGDPNSTQGATGTTGDVRWVTHYHADQSDPAKGVIYADIEQKTADGGSIYVSASCATVSHVQFSFTSSDRFGKPAPFDYFASNLRILKTTYQIDDGPPFVTVYPFLDQIGSQVTTVEFAPVPTDFKPVTLPEDAILDVKGAQSSTWDADASKRWDTESEPQDVATFLGARTVRFQLSLKGGSKEILSVSPQEKSFQQFLGICSGALPRTLAKPE